MVIFKRKFIRNVRFYTKNCKDLSNKEIADSSRLYSNHYGRYSMYSPKRPGEQIKFGENSYRKFVEKENYYVSFAYKDDQLIGMGYYVFIRSNKGAMSWIIQLVVHQKYRKLSIGKRLLLSVWGFSGDRAWGLATSNPLTIKTLESSTFRDVNPSTMEGNIKLIRRIAHEVDFIKVDKISITDKQSIVDTDFFVDHKDIKKNIRKSYKNKWKLGDLPEGHEWIAFTFAGQPSKELTKSQFKKYISHSDAIVQEAYSRMNMPYHNWAQYHKTEIEFIINFLNLDDKNISICDFGCGIGRHIIELNKNGYDKTIGIDFSKSNIDRCIENTNNMKFSFLKADCRDYKSQKHFDLILCLYDVIGSFPKEKENIRIIKNIYKNLRKNGYAVLTVMNMELTEHLVKEKIDIFKESRKLIKLKPSNTMQSTGNVFNPDHILIDKKSKLIYRKEQFYSDNHLAAEYIVRDRRYTMREILKILKAYGFKIILSRFVQVGDWNTSLPNTHQCAKEILIIVQK